MSKRISILELNILIYFLVRSSCFFNTDIILHSSIVSFIISCIIGFGVLFISFFLLKKDIKLGFISTIIIIIYMIILYLKLINFISSEYLFDTPKIFIGLMFLIPIILINRNTNEVIGRVGLILFYGSIVLLSIMIFGLLYQVDVTNFLPIKNTFFNMSIVYLGIPLLLITDLPVDRPRLSFKKMIFGYLLGCFSVFITIFIIIGIYGYDMGSILHYPAFQVLKRLSLRSEHFIFMQWILDVFILESLGVSHIKKKLKASMNSLL